ncbi:MAG: hypothetical protein ACRCXT_06785 [Paraclostridium sp.]
MQEFKNVKSSQTGYPEEVDTKSSPTTVYIRNNIKRIDEEKENGFHGWEYDEIQYTVDEYNANKISILEGGQKSQDALIQSTQDAVDFMLLSNMPMMMALDTKNINTEVVSNIANYIALRVIQKGEISEKAGRDYYVTFMTHQSYSHLKTEVDVILKATGNENLIVDLSK